MRKLAIFALAFGIIIGTGAVTSPQASAGPRCGPHAHWVAGHWTIGPRGRRHWVPGRCV